MQRVMGIAREALGDKNNKEVTEKSVSMSEDIYYCNNHWYCLVLCTNKDCVELQHRTPS